MLTINMRPDMGAVHRALSDLHAKQIPFATTLAMTHLAQGVQRAETEQIDKTFDKATPFTERAFFITPATKSRQIIFVSAKDIQAQYLAPYVFGGERFLGSKKSMLVPKNIAVNQYGNLPRGRLKQLQGKPGIFIGQVKTKKGGVINGVWQRPLPIKVKGMRGKVAKPVGGLKLLIRFEDTTPTTKHFPFMELAKDYIRRNAKAEFAEALKFAIRTARK
jgi:hypothetical protein